MKLDNEMKRLFSKLIFWIKCRHVFDHWYRVPVLWYDRRTSHLAVPSEYPSGAPPHAFIISGAIIIADHDRKLFYHCIVPVAPNNPRLPLADDIFTRAHQDVMSVIHEKNLGHPVSSPEGYQ